MSNQELVWENAEIESTFIGIEDHGVIVWHIVFVVAGCGQGTGMRGLAAESLVVIENIVNRFGQWEKLIGTVVRVGRIGGAGPIVAMRHIMDDTKEVRF